jgi:ferredoxin
VSEILDMVKNAGRVLVVGCKGCVTVCNVGGAKEAAILASTLRIARRSDKSFVADAHTLERQCDPEYINELEEILESYDAVVSLACGVGPQFIAEQFPSIRVFPGVNTRFMGGAVDHGVWSERCAGCGTCVVHYFGGVCPIARCSKSLMNGPCGGSTNGKCEVSKDIDCIWDIIVKRMMEQNRMDELLEFKPPKSWATARDGGPRKLIKEELVK